MAPLGVPVWACMLGLVSPMFGYRLRPTRAHYSMSAADRFNIQVSISIPERLH
jgi:hypothetical protein